MGVVDSEPECSRGFPKMTHEKKSNILVWANVMLPVSFQNECTVRNQYVYENHIAAY